MLPRDHGLGRLRVRNGYSADMLLCRGKRGKFSSGDDPAPTAEPWLVGLGRRGMIGEGVSVPSADVVDITA